MARNGSGVYSLPAGSTVANGDTSDASDLNTPLQDIETDLNTPRPVVAGGTGASSASAARTNLAVPGLADNATITGTWTFDQATGADTGIVTGTAGSDGDVATWNADGDVVGGTRMGLEFIAKSTASASTQITFNGFNPSKYDSYIFIFQNLRSTVDGDAFEMLTSTTGGSPYDQGASDYTWGFINLSHSTTTPNGASNSSDNSIVLHSGLLGASSGEDISGELKMYAPASVRHTRCTWALDVVANNGISAFASGSGSRKANDDVTAVLFRFQSGNISSGSIVMYGLRGY